VLSPARVYVVSEAAPDTEMPVIVASPPLPIAVLLTCRPVVVSCETARAPVRRLCPLNFVVLAVRSISAARAVISALTL